MAHEALERWHALLRSRDLAGLDEILADDVVFHSPVVHTPQRGKEITKLYLTAAFHVLFDSGFHYVREVASGDDTVLEFMATIDGIHINGVDMQALDRRGRRWMIHHRRSRKGRPCPSRGPGRGIRITL